MDNSEILSEYYIINNRIFTKEDFLDISNTNNNTIQIKDEDLINHKSSPPLTFKLEFEEKYKLQKMINMKSIFSYLYFYIRKYKQISNDLVVTHKFQYTLFNILKLIDFNSTREIMYDITADFDINRNENIFLMYMIIQSFLNDAQQSMNFSIDGNVYKFMKNNIIHSNSTIPLHEILQHNLYFDVPLPKINLIFNSVESAPYKYIKLPTIPITLPINSHEIKAYCEILDISFKFDHDNIDGKTFFDSEFKFLEKLKNIVDMFPNLKELYVDMLFPQTYFKIDLCSKTLSELKIFCNKEFPYICTSLRASALVPTKLQVDYPFDGTTNRSAYKIIKDFIPFYIEYRNGAINVDTLLCLKKSQVSIWKNRLSSYILAEISKFLSKRFVCHTLEKAPIFYSTKLVNIG
jgi:hypothetical protein